MKGGVPALLFFPPPFSAAEITFLIRPTHSWRRKSPDFKKNLYIIFLKVWNTELFESVFWQQTALYSTTL